MYSWRSGGQISNVGGMRDEGYRTQWFTRVIQIRCAQYPMGINVEKDIIASDNKREGVNCTYTTINGQILLKEWKTNAVIGRASTETCGDMNRKVYSSSRVQQCLFQDMRRAQSDRVTYHGLG